MSMMVGARGGRTPEINVTPLIDVLLVLLIIFLVVLPERHQGEQTLIPQPAPTDAVMNPPTPIVIQLKDVGESKRPILTINSEEVSWDELEGRLRAIYARRDDRVAFVKGDPEVEFAYVAEAVDITHHAGADRVGLMGQKE
jgi:biopolymer transport protein TolR